MKPNPDFLNLFHEVQARHSKRMSKIMELILSATSKADFELLSLLVDEELDKRREDRKRLIDGRSGHHPSATRGKGIEVLAWEITDETVVFFLKQKIERIRELHDLQDNPPVTEEPERE